MNLPVIFMTAGEHSLLASTQSSWLRSGFASALRLRDQRLIATLAALAPSEDFPPKPYKRELDLLQAAASEISVGLSSPQ